MTAYGRLEADAAEPWMDTVVANDDGSFARARDEGLHAERHAPARVSLLSDVTGRKFHVTCTRCQDLPERWFRDRAVAQAMADAHLVFMHELREEEARKRVFIVSSRSQEDMRYLVQLDWRGEGTCDCAGFWYRKNCWHLQHAKEQGTKDMTSEYDNANDFLMAGGVPAAKFDAIGKMVKGVVVSAEVRDQTDLKTGEVLRWKDNNPRQQLVITLDTDELDPEIEGDDGARRVYAKSGMLNAIRQAVRPHGGIAPGGQLAVKYIGDGKSTTAGFSPPKQYKAWYEPPAQKVQIPDAGPADEDESPF